MAKKKHVKAKKKPTPKTVTPESIVLPDEIISKPYTIDEATEDGHRVGYALGYDAGQDHGIIVGAMWGVICLLVLEICALWVFA